MVFDGIRTLHAYKYESTEQVKEKRRARVLHATEQSNYIQTNRCTAATHTQIAVYISLDGNAMVIFFRFSKTIGKS